MSMSTEEALKYLTPENETKEPAKVEEVKADTSSVETEKETTKSEDSSAKAPEETAEPEKVNGDPAKSTDKGSDEPKPAEDKVVEKKDPTSQKSDKNPKPTKEEQKSYAFARKNEKLKEAKSKIAEQEAEIKKLRAELEKRQGLELRHFKNEDGTQNVEAYLRYRDGQKDLENQIQNLTNQSVEEQRQMDIEIDREATERCFTDPTERQEYENLRQTIGGELTKKLMQDDPKGVIVRYLDTLRDYPVVLRELLQPQKNKQMIDWLFRSKDPYTLHRSIAKVSDDILDNWYKSKQNPAPAPIQTQVAPQPQPQNQVPTGTVPILGHQVTAGSNGSNTNGLFTSMADINDYLRSHPRGR